MRNVTLFIVLVCMLVAAGAQARGRIVRTATTNLTVYVGSEVNTNMVGYTADWVAEDKGPARVREISRVYASAVTGDVSVAVVKNGVTVPRYTASLSNQTSFVWEPTYLGLQKGDRLVITDSLSVTNTTVIDLE